MCPFANGDAPSNGIAAPAKSGHNMTHIPTESMADTYARVKYLKTFLSFTAEDQKYLHASKAVIAPLLPAILEAVYVKLLSFDITAAAFVPPNTGYTGPTVKNVQELSLDHPQILMRKDFLKGYLVKLVTADYSDDSKIWEYFNNVGIMHTGRPGFEHRQNRPDLKVDYLHMGALLGYVVDLVIGAVMKEESLDDETKMKVMQAFNKVLWIQNDLFARHYVSELAPKPAIHQQMQYALVVIAILTAAFASILYRKC